MKDDRRVALHIAAGIAALTQHAAGAAVLDAEERARAARLRLDADRLSFCAAHVLLRQSLTRQVPLSPAQWRFCHGEHGRPEIDTNLLPDAMGLHFNLSHTREVVCCAVTRVGAVGVDVECHRPIRDRLALATRFFTADEAAAIAASGRDSDAAEAASFYSFWTLKEAYVKARGLGISMGLDRFAFRLGDVDRPGIALEVEPDAPAPADAWRCLLLRLDGGRCLLAVVVRALDMISIMPLLHAGGAPVPSLELVGATRGVELLPVVVLD
jgi:4'-phosphopantetheinyl transferase